MARLSGRNAIVTGASRGLGRAIARAMAAEGAAVAVVARTEQMWDPRLPGTVGETVAEIEASGGRAVAIVADLLDDDDRVRIVAEARAALGPITLLVNNAAFTARGGPPKPQGTKPGKRAPQSAVAPPGRVSWPTFLTTPLPAYQRHFEMVFAAYALMQQVVPDMEAASVGAIINVTSGASRMPGDGPFPVREMGVLAGYGGSKAALEHLTQCAGYELTDHGISVNALSPSRPILTPGVRYYAKGFGDCASEEDFAEAAIRLALVDPAQVTGRVVGHESVLDGSFRPFELAQQP